jgi:hypothetical protein
MKCKLGEEFRIKGDVKKGGLLKKYIYQITIGSSNGESLVAENLKASDFEGEGYAVNLGKDYVNHASPYGDGRACYINVTGVKEGGLLTDEETVKYVAYVSLYGALIPKLEITVETKSKEGADFSSYAVKGFSSVMAKVKVTEKNFGAEINTVQFTGGVFSKICGVHQPEFDPKADEYTASVDTIEAAGELFVFVNVTTNYGYGSSASASFKVLNYSQPVIKMTKQPVRFKETDGVITEITSSDDGTKEEMYPFRFEGSILPCEMKNEDGEQICEIKTIEKNAVIKRVNDSATTRIELTTDEDTFSFSGTPKFSDEDEGTKIFFAYDIGITCTDSSGKKYTLVYRMNTLGTAFHLGLGGNKAKFGGYSDEEDTLGSAWDIHGEKDIRADGTVKGNMFRVSNGIYFSEEDDAEGFVGVGEGNDELARGNHSHGCISNNGYLIIDGEAVKNVILATNRNGEISYISKISESEVTAGYDADVQSAAGIDNLEVTVGSPGSGMCFADHVHPYSGAWKDDEAFINLVKTVDELNELIKFL